MTTIYKEALNILTKRGVKFVEKFTPKLLCSYATHIANLENHERKFYLEHDRVPDLRLHIMLVAPPGFYKSTCMKQLMHPDYGLLYTNDVPMRFEGFSTESGMIGSLERSGKTTERVPGLFEEFKTGIVGIEEFFAITQSMSQSHSSHLEPALNQALLDGDVRKRLRGGVIEYETSLTMWGGTQTTRFEVAGGLVRRILAEIWTPTDAEKNELKQALRQGINLSLNPKILEDFRSTVHKFTQDMKIIKEITYTDNLFDYVQEAPHYRIPTLLKLALGYALLNEPIDRKFIVDVNSEVKKMVDDTEHDRKVLIGDPEGDMIISIINDHGGHLSRHSIKEEMIDFSVRYETSDGLITKLVGQRELMWDRATDTVYTPTAWKGK